MNEARTIGPVRWQARLASPIEGPTVSTNTLSARLGSGKPITILHAPAGFGKTCTMSAKYDELLDRQIPVAWISGEALAVSGLGSEQALDEIRIATHGADVVFFDDPDRVDPTIFVSLLPMFAYASLGKRLIAGARQLAGFHLPRQISQGVAEVIDGKALAWPRRLFSEVWQGRLSASQIRSVYDLTEGWPAPTQMLARWLAGGGASERISECVDRGLIADYLDDEVLATLPAGWLSVLVACATTENVNSELIKLIDPGSGLHRAELEAQIKGLISPSGEPGTWRYNRLLQGRLAAHLDRKNTPEQRSLLRIASDWAADRGDVVRAARLAALSGDRERIVDVTTRAGGLGIWLNRGYDTIRTLVKVAGEDIIDAEPRLQLLQCIVLLKDGRIGDADRRYRNAVTNLTDDTAAERDAAIVEAALLIYGCRPASVDDDRLFRRLAELCSPEDGKHLLPTLQAIRNSQQARFGEALASIATGLGNARAVRSDFAVLFLEFHATGVAMAQGSLAQAAKVLSRARRLWQTKFPKDQGAGTVLSALSAQLEFERGRARHASRHLNHSGHHLPHSEAWLDVYVAEFEPRIRLVGQEHGVAAALAAIERLRIELIAQGLERIADLLKNLGGCIVGEAALFAQDNGPTTLGAVEQSSETNALSTWQEREFGKLATSYQLLIGGQPKAALQVLDELIDYSRERGLRRTLQRGLLLQTAALDQLGECVPADRAFEEALSIARRTGMKRAFSDFGGPGVAARLSVLKARNDGAAIDGFLNELAVSWHAAPAPIRRSLTRREVQILGELVAGGSDKIIARRIGVTEHAVRFHLKNIYSKLGVHDRAGAVAGHTLLNDAQGKPTR